MIEDGDLDGAHLDKLDQQLAAIACFANGIGPSLTHVFDTQGQSTGLVNLAHQHGLLVHAYTARADQLPSYVSSFTEFLSKIFIDEKLDGVFSDFTDQVVAFLRHHKMTRDARDTQ